MIWRREISARTLQIKNNLSRPDFCLGRSEARIFTEILQEKLQDPEFRAIEGFPIAKDEDILTL